MNLLSLLAGGPPIVIKENKARETPPVNHHDPRKHYEITNRTPEADKSMDENLR